MAAADPPAAGRDAGETLTEVSFVSAVPGFPGLSRFALVPIGGPGSPLMLLRSTEVDDLEFVVVPPFPFFPGYEPEIDDPTVAALGLERAEDAAVLVILTVGPTPEQTTANLVGPIVIHTRTGAAVQAILHDPELSTKTPLVA